MVAVTGRCRLYKYTMYFPSVDMKYLVSLDHFLIVLNAWNFSSIFMLVGISYCSLWNIWCSLSCLLRLSRNRRVFVSEILSSIYSLFAWLWTRVMLCLKRALRIANAAQQMSNATRGSTGPVSLFIEILNK